MNTGPKTLEEYESAYKRVFATDQVRRRMLAILMHELFFRVYDRELRDSAFNTGVRIENE